MDEQKKAFKDKRSEAWRKAKQQNKQPTKKQLNNLVQKVHSMAVLPQQGSIQYLLVQGTIVGLTGNQAANEAVTLRTTNVMADPGTPTVAPASAVDGQSGNVALQFMSDPNTRPANSLTVNNVRYTPVNPGPGSRAPSTINVNGTVYTASVARRICKTLLEYALVSPGSLVDGGCNGGLAGDDCRVLAETELTCKVEGVCDSQTNPMKIGTVAMLIETTEKPIIGIFHQYALYGEGKSVHANNQLRWFGSSVDDNPAQFGGRQCVVSPEGHHIPLCVDTALPYMVSRKPTEEEMS